MSSPAAASSLSFRLDWLPGVLYGVFMLANAPTGFLLPIFFAEELHFSGNQIGILFALQAITGVLASFPAGLGNDRVTSRSLAALALVSMGIGLVLMTIVKSFTPYIAVFFLWAISNNLFRTSLDVQVLKTDQGDRTGSRLGLYHGGRFLGLTLGMIGGGYVLSKLDFSRGLIVIAVVSFLMTMFVLQLAPTRIAPVRWADYRADFSDRRAFYFAAWLFLFATHWGPEQTCYSLFLRQDLHLNLVQIGWYMSGEFAAILATFALVANRFNQTKHMSRYAIAGLFFSGLGHIGMVIPWVTPSVAFRVVHGVGDGLIMMVMYVGIARLFEVERLGGNAGLINLAAMAGSVFGALVAGPVGERFGYALPLWISGVLTLLLMVPIVFRGRLLHRR